MAFRITIGRKIGVGFGTLIFLTFIAFGLTLITLNKSREINDKITNLYTPSVSVLQELYIQAVKSKMLIANWVNIQKESEDKEKLKKLIKSEYPELKKRVNELANEWDKDDKGSIDSIFNLQDQVFSEDEYIMSQLNTFESYESIKKNDPFVWLDLRNLIEDGDSELNEKTRKILNSLSELIDQQNEQAKQKNKQLKVERLKVA